MCSFYLGDDHDTAEAQRELNKSKNNGPADLPEVEIVSLLQEPLPKYRLRADYLTQHGGYTNQDFSEKPVEGFVINTPTLSTEQEQQIKGSLTPEQAEATLEYFVLCGNRLSQMTQTYHDVDAVTRLLQVRSSGLI